MGDRTYVTLIFPTEFIAEVEMIYENEPDYRWEAGEVTHFGFGEVNYGELAFLETLQERGIPYDSCWESGNEYGPGTEYCRFTPDGEINIVNIYDADINPDIDVLLKLIHDYDALKRYILNHKEETTALPWDNQVKYAKIYRAKQLISS